MKRPEAPTVRETLRGLRDTLEAAGVESAGAEADRLLAHVLGVERSRLALEGGASLAPDAAAELARLLARRTAGEPLQHLEGTVAFRDLLLRADRRALIPRPETEQLLELIARELRRSAASAGEVRTVPRPGAPRSAPLVQRALDVGTGGGAIALSLVAEGIAGRVLGLDVSAEALEQALENRGAVGVDQDRVEFRTCGADPFEAVGKGESFGLIVSNPPYVRDDELAGLPVEVREHEPRIALAGGADGLDLVRTIARRAPDHLVPGGRLFVEIGASQGPDAREVLAGCSAWTEVDCHPDLSGRDRFVAARRA